LNETLGICARQLFAMVLFAARAARRFTLLSVLGMTLFCALFGPAAAQDSDGFELHAGLLSATRSGDAAAVSAWLI
jgi:hypothetical protein